MARMKPWVIKDGDIIKKVDGEWCEKLKEKDALRIIKETMYQLYYFDHPEWLVWYEIGVLNATDADNDVSFRTHLEQGLGLIQDCFPLFEKRVRKQMEKRFGVS